LESKKKKNFMVPAYWAVVNRLVLR